MLPISNVHSRRSSRRRIGNREIHLVVPRTDLESWDPEIRHREVPSLAIRAR